MAKNSAKQLLQTVSQLETSGRIKEAVGVLRELTHLLPKSLLVYEKLGECLVKLNEFNEAETILQKALELSKEPEPRVYKWLGICRFKQGRHEAALECLIIANSKNKTDPLVSTFLGEALYKNGDGEEAVRHLQKACNESSATAVMWYSLAHISYALGKKVEAAHAVKRSIELGDNSMDALILLGLSAAASGDLEVAQNAFLRAHVGHRSPESVGEQWINALVQNAGLDASIEWYRAHVRSDEPADCLHYAVVLLKSGRSSDAASIAQAALERHPRHIQLKAVLSRALALDGDWQRACEVADPLWEEMAKHSEAGKSPPLGVPPPIAPDSLNRLVYIAVEIAGRELESRLLLALRLAERNVSSIIVSSHLLANAALKLPVGLYLLKTMNSYDTGKIKTLKNTAHRFAALDEEQLSSYGSDWNLTVGVDPNIVNAVDLVMANNDRHRDALFSSFPQLKGKVVTTGNPRIELLDEKFAAALAAEGRQIKQKYGKIVLVCTNFGGFASSQLSYLDICRIMYEALNRRLDTEEGQAIIQMGKDFALAEARSIAALIEMVPKLAAAMPDITVVVRPHPAETNTVWQSKFAGITNVVIAPPGTLQGWLRAAGTMIYFAGCMTGVEAKLCGTPAIRFEAGSDLQFPKCGLSAHVNPRATNADDVIRLTRALMAGGTVSDHDYENDARVLNESLLVPPPAPSVRCAEAVSDFFEKVRGISLSASMFDNMRDVFQGEAHKEQTVAAIGGSYLLAAKRVTTGLDELRQKTADLQRAIGSTTEISVIKLADGATAICPTGAFS
jgi:surface carbohydrate biosynthesis protein